jgi:hypothetical protein
MSTSPNHAVVSVWFAQRMATGDIARDPNAHAQAILAKEDLVRRLDAGKGASGEAVAAWFGEKIATGAIARNTVAYNQAFAARDDLLVRLGAAARPRTSFASPRRSVPRPSQRRRPRPCPNPRPTPRLPLKPRPKRRRSPRRTSP